MTRSVIFYLYLNSTFFCNNTSSLDNNDLTYSGNRNMRAGKSNATLAAHSMATVPMSIGLGS